MTEAAAESPHKEDDKDDDEDEPDRHVDFLSSGKKTISPA
jgi:hypothetical protein